MSLRENLSQIFRHVRFKVTYVIDNTVCYPLRRRLMTVYRVLWHEFANKYSRVSKFILCKLHDSFFVHGSVAKRKLHECWQTAIQCRTKFCVLAGKLSLVFTNFR